MRKVSGCLWSAVVLVGGHRLAVFRCNLFFVPFSFSCCLRALFEYILAPKVSATLVSCHRSIRRDSTVPLAESLMIQLHSWLLVLSLTQTHKKMHKHTFKQTLTNTHAGYISFVLLDNQPLGHSHIHSFIHPTVLQVPTKFNSKTDKCVACQQSTIGPFDLCRLLSPFFPSCLFLSVFLMRERQGPTLVF